MKKIKRDQRQYELVQQRLPGLILGTMLGIVEDLGDPYRTKPGLGGMTAYPPKAMVVVCILMGAEARTYRKMVDHLRINPNLVRTVGLPRIPSKGAIWRAYGMIPEPYLREVHITPPNKSARSQQWETRNRLSDLNMACPAAKGSLNRTAQAGHEIQADAQDSQD